MVKPCRPATTKEHELEENRAAAKKHKRLKIENFLFVISVHFVAILIRVPSCPFVVEKNFLPFAEAAD